MARRSLNPAGDFSIDAMFDSTALGILASLGLGVWGTIVLAVLAGNGAPALLRKLKSGPDPPPKRFRSA